MLLRDPPPIPKGMGEECAQEYAYIRLGAGVRLQRIVTKCSLREDG